MNNFLVNKTVLITGSTSGLGFALAVEYLKKGYRVAITGRTEQKIQDASLELQKYNGFIGGFCVDVTNAEAMESLLKGIDDKYKIDILIANAGVSAGIVGGGLSADNLQHLSKEIFNINVFGVFNSVHPTISCMQNRGGSIVLISSMSAFFGLKSAVFYASSKAAIKSYGEGLRVLLADYNINVTTVFPGFVESNITKANKFKMPLLMTAEKAANIIIKGIERKKGYIMFPKLMYFSTYIVSILPFWLREKILKKLPNK